MVKTISVIGGDLRNVKLIEMLIYDGYTVYTYALEKAENIFQNEKVIKCNTLQETINLSSIIIGPIPLSKNKININTPFSSENISIEKLLSNISNKKLFTGSISEELTKFAKEKEIDIIDLMKIEELTILNTISTAEGAIQIAMQETLTTIHSSNVLILGFGRVRKNACKNACRNWGKCLLRGKKRIRYSMDKSLWI